MHGTQPYFHPPRKHVTCLHLTKGDQCIFILSQPHIASQYPSKHIICSIYLQYIHTDHVPPAEPQHCTTHGTHGTYNTAAQHTTRSTWLSFPQELGEPGHCPQAAAICLVLLLMGALSAHEMNPNRNKYARRAR